jgi:hypothetical protein
MVGSSESWSPQSRPLHGRLRAGGGAVHSITSGPSDDPPLHQPLKPQRCAEDRSKCAGLLSWSPRLHSVRLEHSHVSWRRYVFDELLGDCTLCGVGSYASGEAVVELQLCRNGTNKFRGAAHNDRGRYDENFRFAACDCWAKLFGRLGLSFGFIWSAMPRRSIRLLK